MKIALLAHNLRGGGAYTLGENVIINFVRLASEHKIVITALKGFDYNFLREFSNVSLWEFDSKGWRDRLQVEKEVARRLNGWNCDWAWWLGNMGIIFPNCRQSVYIRNAYAVDYPIRNWGAAPLFFILKQKLRNIFIRRTLRRCVNAYVQTETMRTRLLRTYPFLDKNHIGLCPVPPLFERVRKNPSKQTLTLMHELSQKDAGKFRALYVSMFNPHKNMDRVIEMFCKYRNELHEVVLYITAKKLNTGYQGNLWKKVKEAGLEESIRFLGIFPQTDVPALFDACDVVFFPSLLETVGHGHNDALFFGRPLIASDLDFAHDICGDAAYYVNPFSTENMKNALLALKNDSVLCKKLVERGRKRLEINSLRWEQIIGRILEMENLK